jgi:hypothetical protein
LSISMYTISFAGSNKEYFELRANTCVMEPAKAPAARRAVLESAPRYIAANDSPKKHVPESSITTGVVSAAVPHPQNSNTNLPVKFNRIVTQPACMKASEQSKHGHSPTI